MKITRKVVLLTLFFPFLIWAQNPVESDEAAQLAEEEAFQQWAEEFWNSLDKQTGKVVIAEAKVVLNVPDNFYFLNADDAEKVLVDAWGNVPGQKNLGMLFPADLTPFDDESWAVTIDYDEDGYVSDEDAATIDYNDLLKQMQSDTRDESEEREELGYEPIELVGWASPPYYDAATHKLHWAQEIKFGDQEVNTLNYNIRMLGRHGVLVLNFIAGMEQKNLIDSNLDTVLALAEFDQGARYSDFNPDLDKVAAYGIGALVAGKVMAKTGILAVALLLLKKFWFLIVIGLGAAGRFFTGKGKEPEAKNEQ